MAVTFEQAEELVARSIAPQMRARVDIPAVVREIYTLTSRGWWVRTGDDVAMIRAVSRNSGQALKEDRLYLAYDRVVCGRVRCAGGSAVATGVDLHGRPVTAATAADVEGWVAYGFEEMTCECGQVSRRPGEAMA